MNFAKHPIRLRCYVLQNSSVTVRIPLYSRTNKKTTRFGVLFNIASTNNVPLASHSRLESRIIRNSRLLALAPSLHKNITCDVFTRSPRTDSSSYELECFEFQHKQRTHPIGWVLCLWRRERDSNPRNGISVHTISNRAP